MTDYSDSTDSTSNPATSLKRFQLGMQKSRLAMYSIALPLVVLLRPSGFHHIGYLQVVVVWALACIFGLASYTYYKSGLDLKWKIDLVPLWLTFDTVFISLLVYFDGGESSYWFMLYISNAAAAAFSRGRRGAHAIIALNSIAYLGLLAGMGQIQGFDQHLFHALGRLAVLFGAAIYALDGIADLQHKRLLIKKLRAKEHLKVEALTRLTVELDQRSRELAEKNAQIESANRLKSQFLANMSHELRTPMNSIIGFTQILEEKLADSIQPRHMKFLKNVLASGQHLLGLINDLLDLSKIEAGKMEVFPEATNVRDVADGVRAVMRGVSDRKNILIDVELPADFPLIVTDTAKLKQILFNLLSNAVKFSDQGSKVTIRGTTLSAADSPLARPSVRIDVIDQGPGISADDQPIVFEEFRQLQGSPNRSHGGTGLGLALVRRFLELQGGAIALASEVGQGSTFSAYLPMVPEGAAQPIPPAVADEPTGLPSPTPKRAKVLIVEDDPAASGRLATTLEAAGYQPIYARHGEEALRLIEKERPAVITLDLVLPGLDGWEVLKQIKTNPSTRDVPVVIVTTVENRELGVALGADDFFVKPVPRDSFLQRVRELASPAGSERPKVLVVDDDPAIHELLTEHLGHQGYQLTSAFNGEEAIRLARGERPSLIVLDMMMPGMSGFEVARELQLDPSTNTIPIVVLTALDLSAQERAGFSGRIVAMLKKETNWPKRVLTTIHDLVERRAES